MTKTPERNWAKDWELCQRVTSEPGRLGTYAKFIAEAGEGWLAALERMRELAVLIGRLGTQVLEARECINNAYHQVDEYTMPQTAKPNEALLEQALKELRQAARILDEAYREVSESNA